MYSLTNYIWDIYKDKDQITSIIEHSKLENVPVRYVPLQGMDLQVKYH